MPSPRRYLYYMYANINNINLVRRARGLNVFSLRPHAGEAGAKEHLASAFLLAQSINHGLMLHPEPVLQYLFFLCQVGLAASPMSNNRLFKRWGVCARVGRAPLPLLTLRHWTDRRYSEQPFNKFFKRGLNVTFSTDDPLMFHFTEQPLCVDPIRES